MPKPSASTSTNYYYSYQRAENAELRRELNQIYRQETLTQAFEEVLKEFDQFKTMLSEVFGLKFSETPVTTQPSATILIEETKKEMGWFYYSGNYEHELRQTVSIKALLEKVQALKESANSLFNYIDQNKNRVSEDFTIIKTIPIETNNFWQDFFDCGYANQGQQNRLLTEISKTLHEVSQIKLDIMMGFVKVLHHNIQQQNLKNIEKFSKIADLSITIDDKNALESSVDTNNPEVLNLIFDKIPDTIANTPFSNGKLPIEVAVEKGENNFVTKLLSSGVDINTKIEPPSTTFLTLISWQYQVGTTPLTLAIEKYITDKTENHLNIAKYLIDKNAKINIPNSDGVTAYELITRDPLLQDHTQGRLNGKNKENCVDEVINNTWFQYGHLLGKLFISPAFDCADKQITKNKDETFLQCYTKSFSQENIISTIKYPAFSLALQNIIPPAYTMLGLGVWDLLWAQSYSAGALYSGAYNAIVSLSLNAAAYTAIGHLPIYQDHPFFVGVAAATVGSAANLALDAISEAYNNMFMGCTKDTDGYCH